MYSVLLCAAVVILTVSTASNQSNDYIIHLNFNNYEDTVFNSSTAWLVLFHRFWCGHCKKFMEVWSNFSIDIFEWNQIVRLAAVECDDTNWYICKVHNIIAIPMVYYLPPFTEKPARSRAFVPGSVDEMRVQLLRYLEDTTKENGRCWPERWSQLLPVQSQRIDDLWSNVNESSVSLLALVVEQKGTYLGLRLILDYYVIRNFRVLRTSSDGRLAENLSGIAPNIKYPALFIVYRNLTVLNVPVQNGTSGSFQTALNSVLLRERSQNVTALREKNQQQLLVQQTIAAKKHQAIPKISQHQLSNTLYLMDLETALHFSLYNEIPIRGEINGTALAALRNYLRVLRELYPSIGTKSSRFFQRVLAGLQNKESLHGFEFGRVIENADGEDNPIRYNSKQWYACRGSSPEYRGFPCGMWILFHTLTVRASVKYNADDRDGLAAVRAVSGYVSTFFGCKECVNHYDQMTSADSYRSIKSAQQAALWLWRAHNEVNGRLSGDKSEDPLFPKVQFPTEFACPACRLPNGNWNESAVLIYLSQVYTNPVIVGSSNTPHHSVSVLLGKTESSDDCAKPNENKLVEAKQPSSQRWTINYLISISALVVLMAATIFAVAGLLSFYGCRPHGPHQTDLCTKPPANSSFVVGHYRTTDES